MTVTDGGIHKGKFRVQLPGKEYMAVRLKAKKQNVKKKDGAQPSFFVK